MDFRGRETGRFLRVSDVTLARGFLHRREGYGCRCSDPATANECWLRAVWFVSAGGHAEPEKGKRELVPPRARRSHRDLDPSDAGTHQCAEFSSLSRMVSQVASDQPGC